MNLLWIPFVIGGHLANPSNALVKLRIDHSQFWGVCSAVVIGEKKILTAGHCYEGEGVKYSFPFEDRRISVKLHPAKTGDFAVGVLSEPIKANYFELGVPKAGTSVVLGGYGCGSEEGRGDGLYREGTSEIMNVSTTSMSLSGPAFACQGDSGGAVFDGDKVVGIIVAVSPGQYSLATRVDSEEAKELIKKY